jgi:hypothetical protein
VLFRQNPARLSEELHKLSYVHVTHPIPTIAFAIRVMHDTLVPETLVCEHGQPVDCIASFSRDQHYVTFIQGKFEFVNRVILNTYLSA